MLERAIIKKDIDVGPDVAVDLLLDLGVRPDVALDLLLDLGVDT